MSQALVLCVDPLLAALSQLWASAVDTAVDTGAWGPEQELVRHAQQGDRQAFDALFRAHVDRVFAQLTRLVGPVPDRDDLTQDVFLAAYRALPRFRHEARFSTWLHRIVVHVAYGHLRQRRRHPPSWTDAEVLPDPGSDSSPEADVARRQLVAHGLQLLERLKPKKRIAFILRVVESLSLPEIAELVEATPAAVAQRVKHAERELQALAQAKRTAEARALRCPVEVAS